MRLFGVMFFPWNVLNIVLTLSPLFAHQISLLTSLSHSSTQNSSHLCFPLKKTCMHALFTPESLLDHLLALKNICWAPTLLTPSSSSWKLTCPLLTLQKANAAFSSHSRKLTRPFPHTPEILLGPLLTLQKSYSALSSHSRHLTRPFPHTPES